MAENSLKSSLLRLPPISKFVSHKQNMFKENASVDDLERFVKECVSNKYGEERVRMALLSVGWKEEQIEKAFKKAKK